MKQDPTQSVAAPPLHPDDPLTVLTGIGPKTALAMAAEGFHSIRDLLLHLPRRYEDRSALSLLDGSVAASDWILVRGRVDKVRVRRIPRRRLSIVDGVLTDQVGEIAVVWFNQPWISRRLDEERDFYFYGQVREAKGGILQLNNPEIEEVVDESERIVPVYPRIARFGGRRLRRLIADCLPALDGCSDPLPEALRRTYDLPELRGCLHRLHAPVAEDKKGNASSVAAELNQRADPCNRRLVFDELLAFACAISGRRVERLHTSAPRVTAAETEAAAAKICFPFILTQAQQRVRDEIGADLGRTVPMARLLQGDVGSGKTAIAALATSMVTAAGHQVAIMAPTELLAEQHERTLTAYLGPNGSQPELLVGSTPAAERRRIIQGLADGTVQVVIGTHALFQERVSYRDLGLVIVDEQHRFGVVQRLALAAKGTHPHLLVMTATPIPRSLALTLYGDLDLSIIDELPPGRQTVRTEQRREKARTKVFDFLRREIAEGGRVFIVYPLIDVSEDVPAAALAGNEESVRRLLPEASIGTVHGRLSREEREKVTAGFRDGSFQVLLATTVVEVGVDVPEATVMVIESAQRFGLSQLHQLRGRVGRGNRQSWCILFTDERLGEPARQRLDVICRSHDGFEIAEADLEQRGPGELIGTRQWGPAGFRFANLVRDRLLIEETKKVAENLQTRGYLTSVRDALALYHPIDLLEGER
ncbi:MAG: ATP-dependent DNA helicase RecG [Acidobacteriota bacterium]|nr:ATP-dependent DNA helicase RecG [Acidobacteriota bacterium]